MEPRIRNRFSPHILTQAAACYGVPTDAVYQLESAESFIYGFERDSHSFILRIGHSLRRTVELIQGEVEWINFLAAGGASVASAFLSQNQRLVELIDDGEGGHFLATAFTKATGRPPTDEDETTAFYERYGQAIGRMHRLTKNYTPSPSATRPQWDDLIMQDAIDFLPPSERPAQQKLEAQIELLRGLPRDSDSYGLVHQDAHGGNFFVDDDGTLTFFDFDDCCYTWFVADLAIVLFYATVGRDDAILLCPDLSCLAFYVGTSVKTSFILTGSPKYPTSSSCVN